MHWIYFSPHFDDAVLSCGGLIAHQTRQGHTVEIWTLCGGDLPRGPYTAFVEELHARWETAENAVVLRRAEDRLACGRLRAAPRHFPIPDSVYRRSVYAPGWVGGPASGLGNDLTYAGLARDRTAYEQGDPALTPVPNPAGERAVGRALGLVVQAGPSGLAADPALGAAPVTLIDTDPGAYLAGFLYPDYHAIFGPIHPEEQVLIANTAEALRQRLPERARLVCPLGVGGHIDHKLTRTIVEQIGRPLWYYADYPYVEKKPEQVETLAPAGLGQHSICLDARDLKDWCNAILAYQSQISTFWPGEEAMCAAIHAYHDRYAGLRLWRP